MQKRKALIDRALSSPRSAEALELLEHISSGCMVIDEDWKVSYVNSYFELVTGVRREEVLGEPLFEAFPQARGTIFEESYRRTAEQSEPTSFEAYYEPLETWFDVQAYPAQEGGFIAFFTDVTEPHQQRQRAERHQTDLRLLERAIEHIQDMIIITDAPREAPPTILYVNEAVTRATGYAREELLGASPSIFQGEGSDPEAIARMDQAIRAREPVHAELVNYTRHGEPYLVELDITPLRDEDGQVEHFVSVQRDITAQRQLEQRYLHAQKLEAIGRLAGGVAHDFNNLLTVMMSSSDMLESMIHTSREEAAEELEHLQRALERANQLTDQLLDFSRGPRSDRPAHRPHGPLDIRELIEDALGLLWRILPEFISLELQMPDHPLLLHTSAGPLEQIITNLVVNARDAMPEGGRLVIAARACDEQGPEPCVELAVSDTGVGIPQELQERIFEPFFTTKGPEQGTGLGLTTIREIVHDLGGTLSVTSAPDQGSTFTLRLPLTPPREDAPAQARSPSSAPPRFAEGARRQILLVEDDAVVRDSIRRMLEGASFRVKTARDGLEAIARLDASPEFGLVLSDLVMPRMSGLELARTLQQRRPDLPLVLMTGYTDHAEPPEGVELLYKPFGRRALLELIQSELAPPSAPTP